MDPLFKKQKRNSSDLQLEDTPEPKIFKTSTDPSLEIHVPPCCSRYSSEPDSDTIGASRTGEHTSDRTATDISNGTKTSSKLIHQCLRHVYKSFKMDIRAADVAPYLYQKNIIDQNTVEWTQEEKQPKRRADILIKAIARSKESFTVADITHCLRMSKYVHIAELLEGKLLEHRDSTDTTTLKGKYAKSRVLSEDTLYRLLPKLERNVEPRDIVDDLLSCGMLTFIDHEDIYIAQSVVDRWKTLLKCINIDLANNFQLLYNVLSNPNVAFDCILPSSSVDDCRTVNNGSSSVLRMTLDFDLAEIPSFAKDQWKDVCIDLKLNGKSGNVRKVETAIVNGSNNIQTSWLQEFFSRELKTSNLNISLHCVRIQLQAISSGSLRLLEDALTTKNGVPFVEKLLNELMTTEKIEQLRQAGTSEVKLEITVFKQKHQASERNLKISKTILQDKYDFLIEEIDGGDFIAMLQDVPEGTETRNAIISEQSRATRNRHLVHFLLSQGQTTLDRFLKEAVDQKLDYIVDLFETEPDQCLKYQEEDASTEDECVCCPKRRRLSNSREKTCLHIADFSIQYVKEESEETDLQLFFKDLQNASEPESSTLHKCDKTGSNAFELSKEKQEYVHSWVEVHHSKSRSTSRDSKVCCPEFSDGPYSIGESSPSTSSSPSTPLSQLSVVPFKSNSISASFLQDFILKKDTRALQKWRQNDDIKTKYTDMPSPPSFPRTRSPKKSELRLISPSSGIGSMSSRSPSPMHQHKAQRPSKDTKPRGSNASPSHII